MKRCLIILMLLLSGNVLPYNKPALTFKVPADLISRSDLGFIHMNVRSLLPKMNLVRIWAKNTSADIIVISETWLNKTVLDKAIGIDGHTVNSADRQKRGGG